MIAFDLPEERRARLLDMLLCDGKIVAAAASAALGVSEDTIRRDLDALARSGAVQRVHGGALPRNPATGPFPVRAVVGAAQKDALGRAAAGLIQPGQSVMLDSGSTMCAVARHIPPGLAATIVTANIPAALALCEHAGIDLVLIGGRVDKGNYAASGAVAIEALAGMRFDLCLLGACSLDPTAGLAANDPDGARIKRRMIDAAAMAVAVATADKLGTRAPFPITPIGRLARLVTEAAAPPALLRLLTDAGVEVTLA